MSIAAVIGTIPRMGKTFLLHLLHLMLLIAAFDPRAELHTYDIKGAGDLDPVGERASHHHRAGDDDEDIEYALADLRDELRLRAKIIRCLPRDTCSESKVTSELATSSRPRSPRTVGSSPTSAAPYSERAATGGAGRKPGRSRSRQTRRNACLPIDRTTCGTPASRNWLNAGVPVAEVARRAGDSPEVIHRRYKGCIDATRS